MYVAIDFGISNTDLAISDQGKIVFHTTPSQSSEISADTLKNILKNHEIDISNVKKIGVTGGKSSDLDDALDGVKIAKINEIDAIFLFWIPISSRLLSPGTSTIKTASVPLS